MKQVPLIFATVILALAVSPLHAASPLGGLTVAASPSGDKVVAGGDTRTLLVLDPETLEVKERHWLGLSIVDLVFNKDGSVLAVHDTSDLLVLLNTSDWSKIAEIPKVVDFAAAPEADVFVGQDGNYKGQTFKSYSFTDGSEQASITLPEGFKTAIIGIKPDGSTAAILSERVKDESEPKVERADIPKDLKGAARKEFEQKNDGDTATFLLIDLAGKKIAKESKTYYSESNGELIFSGDEILIVNYSNENAKVNAAGEFSIFELENSYNYGIGFGKKNEIVLSGGLANFSITNSGTLEAVTGKVDKIGGWPEYFKGFSGTPDGSKLYGATTAFRVFRFNADGTIAATMQGH